jgi:hypothetical protein
MTSNTRRNASGAAADQKLPQVKAELLRSQTLAARGLGGLDPEATLNVFAAALLAESEDGYNRESALGIMQRARKVSLLTLAASVRLVTQQLAAAMIAFWNEFVKQTWQGPDAPPAYVDPGIVSKRKDLEEQEQEQNRKDALQYTNNAQIAIGALVIDDKEFPKAEGLTSKTAPRVDLGKMLHGLIYKPVDVKPGEAAKAVSGWLTPPLLNKTDEDVTIFDSDIMAIVADKKLSGEQAWKKLEDRGYDRRRIVQSIYNVRKTALAQSAQCDQILAFIHNDYETHFGPVIKAAVLLGHAISAVNAFYSPLPLAADDETSNRQPTWPAQRRGK